MRAASSPRARRTAGHNVLCAFAVAALIGLLTGAASHPVVVGQFSNGDLNGWEEKSFQGHTAYTLIHLDSKTVLHARCESSASVLYLERPIDLQKTPWLRWRWRVDDVFKDIDERSKAGDDYPARVYVVDAGLLPWHALAVNYVWASREPPGAHWPSAYTNNAHMLALRSGKADTEGWRTETRNVRQDFKRFHGKDVKRIDGIAVMTDCDDTGGQAEAWYGNIEFFQQPPKGGE